MVYMKCLIAQIKKYFDHITNIENIDIVKEIEKNNLPQHNQQIFNENQIHITNIENWSNNNSILPNYRKCLDMVFSSY